MSASFWKLFGIGVVSTIDNLLQKEDVTLEQLFNEDELLNECKYGNKNLLTFLLRPTSLKALFEFLAYPQPPEADAKAQRYPDIASEVLCTEGLWEFLSDSLFGEHTELIEELWKYFLKDKEEIRAPNVAAVSKVARTFFERQPAKCFALIPKANTIDALLEYCGHGSVVELLLKLEVASQLPSNEEIKEWIDSHNLIAKLLEKLDPNKATLQEREIVSDALQEQLSRADSQPMIARLQSAEPFETLLRFIVTPSPVADLLPVLSLIIGLLRHDAPAGLSYDSQTDLTQLPIYISKLLEERTTQRFSELLSHSSGTLVLAHGTAVPLIGSCKLKIVETINSLVVLRKRAILSHLNSAGILTACIELFFSQPWNNFLHKFTVDMLLSIFDNSDIEVTTSVLERSRLLDRIGEADEKNQEEIRSPKRIQRGYMAHLAILAEALLAEAVGHPQLMDLFKASPGFIMYLNRTLYPTQRRTFCWQTLSGLPEKYHLFDSHFSSSIPESLRNEHLVEPMVQFPDHDPEPEFSAAPSSPRMLSSSSDSGSDDGDAATGDNPPTPSLAEELSQPIVSIPISADSDEEDQPPPSPSQDPSPPDSEQ